jgi:hypothetical protein
MRIRSRRSTFFSFSSRFLHHPHGILPFSVVVDPDPEPHSFGRHGSGSGPSNIEIDQNKVYFSCKNSPSLLASCTTHGILPFSVVVDPDPDPYSFGGHGSGSGSSSIEIDQNKVYFFM